MKTSKIVVSILLIIAVAIGLYLIIAPDIKTDSDLTGNTVDLTSVASMSLPENASVSNNARIIYVNATRFTYAPDTITVKKGEHVKIMINNIDTNHGMYIPELKVSGIDSVEFTADTVGNYSFRCPTMCGSGHRNMTGQLIVTE